MHFTFAGFLRWQQKIEVRRCSMNKWVGMAVKFCAYSNRLFSRDVGIELGPGFWFFIMTAELTVSIDEILGHATTKSMRRFGWHLLGDLPNIPIDLLAELFTQEMVVKMLYFSKNVFDFLN
jgi:hypothetical protein